MTDVLAATRVMVTGAGGFIGKHLDSACRGGGADVTRLHRQSPSAIARQVERAAPQIIFHLAALTEPDRDPKDYLEANVKLTRGLLEAASQIRSLDRFVYVGTCGEYGDAPSPLVEDGPCRPLDPYGESKLAATRLVLSTGRRGLPVTVVRPFLTFGPGQGGPRLLPSLFRAVARRQPLDLTEGSQSRDFVFVSDVVRAVIALARNPKPRGLIVNVGSGRPRSIRSLCRELLDIAGLPDDGSLLRFGRRQQRPAEPHTFFADETRLRSFLPDFTLTPWRRALTLTLDAYRQAA